MDTIINNLTNHFNTVLGSNTDSQFYFNLHKYIDFIEDNETLLKILKKSEIEYSKDFPRIEKPDSISDDLATTMDVRVRILEQNSIYAKDYAFLKVRIYDNVLWNDENEIKQNAWYKNKRNDYQNKLQEFHRMLLSILNKDNKDISYVAESKIEIIIDSNKGIYRLDNEKLFYPIKRGTKRLGLVMHITVQDKNSISELENKLGQTKELLMKEIKEINKNFRKNLRVADDLIIHHNTGSYSINKDSFNIAINP